MTRRTFGFQDSRYRRFPPVVQIALVAGICPSHCRYCPVGRKNHGELSGPLADELATAYFPLELFTKVAEEVAGHPWSILRIHGRGEPMAHPDYVRMISYAKDVGVGVVTSFTNGIYLERQVEDILDARLDLLEISADAADDKHYRRWRRNPHFQRVVDGVSKLFEARNARAACPTRIVVSAVDHPTFRPHREEFEAFWGPTCDKVIVRPFHTYAGRIRDPYRKQRDVESYTPCVQLWERFSISPEGLVNACFNDWGDHEIVGDLRPAGAKIASVWRCEKFETIRDDVLRGPTLGCCLKCSGPSLSSWGKAGYQHWVRVLLAQPPKV